MNSILRKRQKKGVTSDELDLSISRALTSKERGKKFRERRQLYYSNLEAENSELKGKIKELTDKVDELQKKITVLEETCKTNKSEIESISTQHKLPKISSFLKLKLGEDFMYNSIPRMIKTESQLVNYS